VSVTYLCLTQVLVMTAQILLNILRHSIIKMDAIHLLILDECHHAVKKHPYSLVMSEFYHTTPKDKRPAVFGMTASPVNLKGMALLSVSLLFHVHFSLAGPVSYLDLLLLCLLLYVCFSDA
jgi:superfamily II DNA or RNA helicase